VLTVEQEQAQAHFAAAKSFLSCYYLAIALMPCSESIDETTTVQELASLAPLLFCLPLPCLSYGFNAAQFTN
jgi:hypothetical protein